MSVPANVIARIRELRAKEKAKTLTDSEASELKELAIKYPKNKGRGGDTKPKPGNDFEYHNKYPELMSAVTKYPWMHITGTHLYLGDKSVSANVGNVLSVKYVMTIGKSLFSTDAFNLSSRDQWLNMHRKYRGMGAYQQSDYGIVRLCNMSIFVELSEAERLYGIMFGYPIKNRVTPRGLLRAMGFTDNFVNILEEDLAAYRANLNRIITKAQRLCLPKGISALYNWMGLSSFLYSDSKDNSDRASIIVFQRAGSWVYDPTAFNTGTAAKFEEYSPASFATPTDYLQSIENHIDKLLEDDDVTRICSDVIACFENANLEALSIMPENYAVTVRYDDSILLKLHNSEILSYVKMVTPYRTTEVVEGSFVSEAAYIHQRDNTIIFQPSFIRTTAPKILGEIAGGEKLTVNPVTPYPAWRHRQSIIVEASLLDTWESEPSEATRCEAVLWKPNYFVTETPAAPFGSAITLSSCATEVLINCTINTVVNGSVVESVNFFTALADDASIDAEAQFLCCLSQIDWAPVVYVKSNDEDGSPNVVEHVIGDIDNYTVFDKSVAPLIFDIATLSDFKVDMVFNNKA